MNISELQTLLISLTKSNIPQTKIAEAFGTTRSNISLRIKNKSVVTDEELKKCEEFFNVDLSGNKDFNIVNIAFKQIQNSFNIDDSNMLAIKTIVENPKLLNLTRIFVDAVNGDEEKANALVGILKLPALAHTFME